MAIVQCSTGNVLGYALTCIQHLTEHYGDFEVFNNDFVDLIVQNIYNPLLNICRPAMAILVKLICNENEEESLRILQIVKEKRVENTFLIEKLIERLQSQDHGTLFYSLQLLNCLFKRSLDTKKVDLIQQMELLHIRVHIMV